MLTESQVQTSFSGIFRGGDCSEDDFAKAEQLIEELRPESPLRNKLASELQEIRKMRAAAS